MNVRRWEFAPIALLVSCPAWALIAVAWLHWSPLAAAVTTFVLSPWVLVPAWIWLMERRGIG